MNRATGCVLYVAKSDPDSRFHRLECKVIDRYSDDLDTETGRELDRYSYRVRRVDNPDVLGVVFRHSDLVPIE